MNVLLPLAGGAVLLAGLAILLVRLPPRKALAAVMLVGSLVLVLMRQFVLAFPLAVFALSLWRAGSSKTNQRPTSGKRSEVETEWLRMRLDHDSGEIDGTILRGTNAGRDLSSLSIRELRTLWSEIDASGETESHSLLEAYIARHRPDAGPSGAWHDEAEASTGASVGEEMSEEEAYEILGLAPGAGPEEVRKAYHRLILKVHPDKGGSGALTALINAARQRLDPG